MEERHLPSLSSPLLLSSAAPSSPNSSSFLPNSGIALRFLLLLSIGTISLWANREASKGFVISVQNDAADSPAGHRFDLFYVSNDEATRMILNASNFVEDLLYPSESYPRKEVTAIHLRLARRNLSRIVAVETPENGSEYFVNLSPAIFGDRDVRRAMSAAVLRGISRVWLWDGESEAPENLLAGMVEYISVLAGFGSSGDSKLTGELTEFDGVWWNNKDPTVVAQFLDYHEGCRKGFIQRLNRDLKSRWHDGMMENALGLPSQRLCGSFNRPGSSVSV